MKRQNLIACILFFFAFLFITTEAARAQQQSITFPCNGMPQYFSVPLDVTQITAEIVGADGFGAVRSEGGGKGGKLTTVIGVTPGQTLTVFSGCMTGYGFTRGGKARVSNRKDSEIWLFSGGGSSAILNQDTVLAVAGGGGTSGLSAGSAEGGKGGSAIVNLGNGTRGEGGGGGQGGAFGGSTSGDGEDGVNGSVGGGIGGSGGGGAGYDPNGGGGGARGTGGAPGGGGGGGGGKSYTNPQFASNPILQLADGEERQHGFVKITFTGASNGHLFEPCTETQKNYVVPSDVRSLRVTAIGGDGGGESLPYKRDGFQSTEPSGDLAGYSGRAKGYTAIIRVTPGEQLSLGAGCQGKLSTLGDTLGSINPGGAGGFGFISGGRGGDGDKPPLLGGGIGGVGGGGASGIGRGGNPLFVAPGGGGGGGRGGAGFFGCNAGEGGDGDGRNGGDASPCANFGRGGLTGGSSPNGGNGCSFCTSAGGGGGGGGYQSGGGGTAGAIGAAGGGGGGGGNSFAAPGFRNFEPISAAEYRRATYMVVDDFYFLDVANDGEIFNSLDGFVSITPLYENLSPPVITPNVSPLQPNGNNGWYRSNISISWTVSSETPILSQTGCGSNVISGDTPGVNSSCSATNAAGTTSGTTQTVKRDATPPNITATARLQNGSPYTFGTTADQPVIVTFACSDATSGVVSCPAEETFGSNAAVSATVTDRAGNTRTVNFGNVVQDNQPPTISAIDDLTTPINTNVSSVPFTISDAETAAANLVVRALSSNQDVVANTEIDLLIDPNNPANRALAISPAFNRVGTTIITVTVTDARGASATESFTLAVTCGTVTIQQPERITYAQNLNAFLNPIGGVAPYTFRQTDGDLPENLEFDPQFNRIVGGPVGDAPGVRRIDFMVTDANGCSNPVTANVTIDCLTNPVVDQALDGDVLSLRGMVVGACPNSTVRFAGFFNNQEVLVDGVISITKPLTIEGLGANKLTVRNVRPPGNGSSVFAVSRFDGEATISGLTVKDGNTFGFGGGIRTFSNLTVKDSLISQNRADGGGGIANLSADKTLTVINTTVADNSSGNNGNFNGGGILSRGPVNIVNSTVSGNTILSGSNGAAGIYAPSGLISNSTITNNTVDNRFGSSGMASGVYGGSTNLIVRSSIIAGNQNNGVFPDVFNLFNSNGFNLIGNRGSVTAFGQLTDQTGTSSSILNPLLDGLMNNGGSLPTHGFLASSGPAIDRGFAFGLTSDQRGMIRTYDFPNIQNAQGGDGTDIGAFELLAPSAATVFVGGSVVTPDGLSLRNASVIMTDSGGNTRSVRTGSFGYFHFDGVEVGQTYIFQVQSKRYTFTPQIVAVNNQISDLRFTAQ